MEKDFEIKNFEFWIYKDKKSQKKRKIVSCKKDTNEYKLLSKINNKILHSKNITFNNKNKIYTALYQLINNKISDYTVAVCDFKDFGHSLNINYCIEKCNVNEFLNAGENYFLRQYADYIKTCRGGINLNTTLAQLILNEFDNEIKSTYKDIIFYERYADDLFIIFNSLLNVQEVQQRLKNIVEKVFYDKDINFANKTELHFDKKFSCFNSQNLPQSFDFLGFNIKFDKKITFDFTENDKAKIKKQIGNIILKYQHSYQSLRIALGILAKGIVYKNKKGKWVFKGFGSRFRFLARFKNFDYQKGFYKSLLKEEFLEKGLKLPSFLNDAGYDLVYNVEHKRFFILDQKGGISKERLLKIMKTLGKNYASDISYSVMVKDLLNIF